MPPLPAWRDGAPKGRPEGPTFLLYLKGHVLDINLMKY